MKAKGRDTFKWEGEDVSEFGHVEFEVPMRH